MRGEIVGGYRGELITSEGIGEWHVFISGKTSVNGRPGNPGNLGEWSGDVGLLSPANVAAGWSGGGRGASASAAQCIAMGSSGVVTFSIEALFIRKKASNPSSGGVPAEKLLGMVATEGIGGIWSWVLIGLDIRRFKLARNFDGTTLLRIDAARLPLDSVVGE